MDDCSGSRGARPLQDEGSVQLGKRNCAKMSFLPRRTKSFERGSRRGSICRLHAEAIIKLTIVSFQRVIEQQLQIVVFSLNLHKRKFEIRKGIIFTDFFFNL